MRYLILLILLFGCAKEDDQTTNGTYFVSGDDGRGHISGGTVTIQGNTMWIDCGIVRPNIQIVTNQRNFTVVYGQAQIRSGQGTVNGSGLVMTCRFDYSGGIETWRFEGSK